MNWNCVIVEDLQVAADYLIKCCEKSGQVEVKGHFTNVADALNYLNQNSVDLLFLDREAYDGFHCNSKWRNLGRLANSWKISSPTHRDGKSSSRSPSHRAIGGTRVGRVSRSC